MKTNEDAPPEWAPIYQQPFNIYLLLDILARKVNFIGLDVALLEDASSGW